MSSKEKPNSLQMMEKFSKALSDIEDINNKLESVKNKMNTKLNIVNTICNYTANLGNSIKKTANTNNPFRIIFGNNPEKIIGGNYDSYGEVVHAKYLKMPTHVFNVITATGPIFKGNVEVSITEENKEAKNLPYRNILKMEADVTKEDVFDVYTSNRIKLTIENDKSLLVSGTKFNVIEICPYLPGSFSINTMKINKGLIESSTPGFDSNTESLNNVFLENVGNIRYQMDKTYDLESAEFDISLNYSDGGGYPFGLRHIYFYDTAADTTTDKIVIKIESPNYIESLGEAVNLLCTDGSCQETTASKYNINFYMFYNNNVLENEIEPNNIITRNIKTFYAVIPMTQPLIGIEFTDIKLR